MPSTFFLPAALSSCLLGTLSIQLNAPPCCSTPLSRSGPLETPSSTAAGEAAGQLPAIWIWAFAFQCVAHHLEFQKSQLEPLPPPLPLPPPPPPTHLLHPVPSAPPGTNRTACTPPSC